MTGPEVTQPDPDGGVEMTDGEWAAFRGETPPTTPLHTAEDVLDARRWFHHRARPRVGRVDAACGRRDRVMTHDEVTAAMKAEDVDAALVEKAAQALSMLRHGMPDVYAASTRAEVRVALAAVLPLHEATVEARVLEDAAITWPAGSQALVARGYVHSWLRRRYITAKKRAARLATTTEEPMT